MAILPSNTVLPEFPAPPGHQMWTFIDVVGPVSYTQVSNGTSPAGPTGGQTVTVPGATAVIWAHSLGSTTGTYDATLYATVPEGGNPNGASFTIRWTVASTGAEVTGATNLSGEFLRCLILYL